MKIAYLHEPFRTSGGGAPLSLLRLTEEMAKRGHEVTVFCAAPTKDQRLHANQPEGVTVTSLNPSTWRQSMARFVVGLQFRKHGYRLSKWLDQNGYFFLLANGTFVREITQPAFFKPFDVVVLFASSTTPWTMAFEKALPKLKHKATFAVPYFHPHEEPGRLPIHKKLHRDIRGIITATAFETEHLRRQGWKQQIIRDVGVGSDPCDSEVSGRTFRERHGIPSQAPLVLFLGRKIYNKGVVHVVEAMDRVWDRFPEAWLALVGFSHNPKSWLKNNLRKSRHDALSRTADLYDVSLEEREEALAACQVMAAPSISDSFGIVYLDAWRHRKPVLACRDTCCESFIEDGRDGHLVGFGDTREIGELLIWHIDNPEVSAKMGKRGYKKWKKRFRWKHVAERTEALFLEGLGAAPRTEPAVPPAEGATASEPGRPG